MINPLSLQILSLILITHGAANAFTLPLPPAQACLHSWSRYYSISESLASQLYTTTLTSTYIWSTFPAVPTSTFCDNIPRLLARQYSDYVTEWYPTATFTTFSTMTSPTPTCTVNEDECAKLRSIWNMTHTTGTSTSDFPVPCTTYTPCTSDPVGPCSLIGNYDFKIYYWPTQATEPLCSQTNTPVSNSPAMPKPTISDPPVVKVIDGLTVTSPSIYISIPTLYGRFHGQPTYRFTGCGSQLTSLTLSIPPSPISTLTRQKRGRRPTYGDPTSFALSTLNWPVTETSSCSVQTICGGDDTISTCIYQLTTTCETPTVDPFNYHPVLLLPTELVHVAAKRDPGYRSCEVHNAAAVGATWIPITTIPGDPRYTKGWSATPTIPWSTVTSRPE